MATESICPIWTGSSVVEQMPGLGLGFLRILFFNSATLMVQFHFLIEWFIYLKTGPKVEPGECNNSREIRHVQKGPFQSRSKPIVQYHYIYA